LEKQCEGSKISTTAATIPIELLPTSWTIQIKDYAINASYFSAGATMRLMNRVHLSIFQSKSKKEGNWMNSKERSKDSV
jgi:hypothetical protein